MGRVYGGEREERNSVVKVTDNDDPYTLGEPGRSGILPGG